MSLCGLSKHITKTPVIINVAFTGAVSSPTVNPNVPVTNKDIVADAAVCTELGASIGHFHVRDSAAKPTNDPARYQDLFLALRQSEKVGDLILCASTSGRHGQTFQERAAVLDLPLEARPDMASLTLSSMNFRDGASTNEPDVIRKLAERMAARGVKPELEIFDIGMVEFAHQLIHEGLITPPYFFNIVLGNVAGAKPSFAHIGALVSNLPDETAVSLGGIGPAQMPAHLMALAGAHGIRIGLEDNLWMDAKRTPASNPALVERFVSLAQLAGREVAQPSTVRDMLHIQRAAEQQAPRPSTSNPPAQLEHSP